MSVMASCTVPVAERLGAELFEALADTVGTEEWWLLADVPEPLDFPTEFTFGMLSDGVWAYGNCGRAAAAFEDVLGSYSAEFGVLEFMSWSAVNDCDGFEHHATAVRTVDGWFGVDWTWAQWSSSMWGAVSYDVVEPFPLVLPLAEFEEKFLAEVADALGDRGNVVVAVTAPVW
jgi:hypothetical protein